MTISERLNESLARLQEKVNELNALENQKQELVKEILRLDGEVRVLNKIKEEE